MKASLVLGKILTLFFLFAYNVHAAISIGIGQTNPLTFDAQPTPASGWTTQEYGLFSSSSAIITTNEMDAAMQTMKASDIATNLPSTATYPPSFHRLARWNNNTPKGFFLQTRPTGASMALLMVTLENDSGTSLSALTLEYDFGDHTPTNGTASETIYGYRVYFSLTGETNSWQVIPELSVETPGHVSATIELGTWPSGTLLFVVWADDNGPGDSLEPTLEGAYSIDNVSFFTTPTTGELTNLAIHLPADTVVSEYESFSLQFQLSGDVPHYQWFKDNIALPNGTNCTWLIASVTPQESGRYFCIASNHHNTMTSRVANVFVQPDVAPPSVQSVESGGRPERLKLIFSEPLNEASATNLLNYVITNAQGASLVISSAILLSNTMVALELAEPRQFLISYYLVVNGVQDLALTPNMVTNQLILVPPVPIQLFGMDQVWRYNASGQNLGNAWNEVNFDDSQWPGGPGILGRETTLNTINAYAAEGEAIRTAVFTNFSVTYYFRTTFVVTNDFTGWTLVSSNYLDDGAVFYLNGRFAGMFAMTNSTPAFDTLASEQPEEGVIECVPLDAELLQPGTNYLAVEVHQYVPTSTDIVLGMRLYLVPPPPLQITRSPTNVEVNVGESVFFNVAVFGQSPQFQWRFNGMPIPDSNLPYFQLINAQLAHTGDYSVFVTNATESVTSQVARLTVWQQPIIHAQPAPLRLLAGQTLQLTPAFSGTDPMSFQWYFNGDLLTNDQQANLIIGDADLSHSGRYWFTISNRMGMVVSDSVVATVAHGYFAALPVMDRAKICSLGMPLSVEVLPGASLSLQFKNDMNESVWQVLTNFVSDSSAFNFLDTQATNHTHRFYRVWKQE